MYAFGFGLCIKMIDFLKVAMKDDFIWYLIGNKLVCGPNRVA